MNATQRNYILSEIDRIISGKLSALSLKSKAEQAEYVESTQVTMQDLIANNRDLLMNLPLNPDTKSHNQVSSLSAVFDFAVYKEKLAIAAGTRQPDVVEGKPNDCKCIDYIDEGKSYGKSYYFFYQDHFKEAKTLLATAKQAKREAILSNNATALKILEDLEKVS